MPIRSQKDLWEKSEIVKLSAFEGKLISNIQDSTYKGEKFMKVSFDLSIMQKSAHSNLGQLTVDPDKCIGCGTCYRKCPYNAIHFQKVNGIVHIDDKEQEQDSDLGSKQKESTTKIPVFDTIRCQHCCRCYNNCPVHAIEFLKCNTPLRGQYKGPQYKPKTDNADETSETKDQEKEILFGKLPFLPVLFWRNTIGQNLLIYYIIAVVVLALIIFLLI
ncbi:MAG: hypothetical protein EZS28_031680 [Streblomastix strix]|uniref:4Fe-4S ferredoxin-type domain-containing protein n=1 Tax=Streblomastix strix TaxID=222440 RepID=A0A5J4URI2_9EUKA|nr:MAG: hypothetical protein EZS28_031680 [Streblomastix strix]